jgi:hypothetical protein
VFTTVATTLHGLLGRIPDGETGPRSRWNSWTAPTYERTAGLELVPPPEGSYTPWSQARLPIDPDDLVLERIGFADAALASYAIFESLCEAGTISPHTRFQVCLPSPIAPMIVLIEERSRPGVEPASLRQLHGRRRHLDRPAARAAVGHLLRVFQRSRRTPLGDHLEREGVARAAAITAATDSPPRPQLVKARGRRARLDVQLHG